MGPQRRTIEWLHSQNGIVNGVRGKMGQRFGNKAAESIIAGAGVKRRQRDDMDPVPDRNRCGRDFLLLAYKFFRRQFFGFSIQEFIGKA